MAANALKKITARAKQIVKKHPNKKWSTAIKEAGREYRAGGIAGTRKKKKPAKKRKVASPRTRSIGSTPASGGSLESQLKRQLKEQLGWCLVSRETAKTKKEKNGLTKRAAELRSKLRALS